MKIVAGIIGFGVGMHHFKAIQGFKGSKIKYICEINSTKRKLLKKKYPYIKIIKDAQSIFTDSEINLVSIASYDNFHYNQVLKCIKTKKNFIVEKPICLNPNHLKTIFVKLKNTKIRMTTNLVLRSNRLFSKFKDEIDVNKLFYIEADYIWGRKEKLFDWRSTINEYSVTKGAAIHMIDLILWLIKLKPVSVISFGNSKATNKTKFKKNNLIVSILKFPKDITVKITANAAGIFEHFHEIKIFQKDITLVNSRLGAFYYKSRKKNKLQKFEKNLYPDKQNRKKIIQNFLNEILKNKKPSIKIKEQIDLMTICFAIDESIKRGKEIKIKYL